MPKKDKFAKRWEKTESKKRCKEKELRNAFEKEQRALERIQSGQIIFFKK